jgi:ribose transport system substrate-binding protein
MIAAAAAIGLAACGSSGSPNASVSSKPLNIAYLSFAVQNSYDAPMLAAATAIADDNHASVRVFDANNSPQTQYSQLQSVINSGQYDGVILQPILGTGLTSLVSQAIGKGIKVVNMDQILGPDLSTDQPQVKGLSANVTFVPTRIGTQLGRQVVAACKAKNLKPCNVGYLWDIKAAALDVAINGAFVKAIAADPDVTVTAEGQSFFSPAIGLTAVQNMLRADPSLNLIVGSDQGIEGGAKALTTAHLTGKVILVGYGASAAALAGVASGAWYSDVAQAPAREGQLAMQALIAAIETGKLSGAIDPVAGLPNDGILTKANAGQFTAEWPG